MKPRKHSYFQSARRAVKGKKQPLALLSNEEKLIMIADAGYETAPDILFPETNKKKKRRLFAIK